MPHRWKQTIQIDEKMAKDLIENQQHLPVHTINLLDEGWDNFAYLVNNSLIFRFPRREFGLNCMENEISILPIIAQHVSFPLSAPEWVGKPNDTYPFPYAGYRLLPGKSLCDATDDLIDDKKFASTLASWLRELHTILPKKDDAAAIKGDQSWRLNVQHRVTRCHTHFDQYQHYFIEAGFEKKHLLSIIERLSKATFSNTNHSYLHGDLYHRHIIVDPLNMQPTGLIDWGDLHVGDPGIDLAVGMIFTEYTFQHFLNAYGPINDETSFILRFHAFFHAMSFLPYAYESKREPLKRWAYLQLSQAVKLLMDY